jgi:serine protease AprX
MMYHMKKLLTIILLLTGFTISAQVAPHKYFVEFKDKAQNPYSLDRPSEFLSARAIQRRQTMGIGYDISDLPVTPAYVQAIRDIGAQILNPTKWLNGVTIKLADTTLINSIKQLSFVKSVVNHSGVKSRSAEPTAKFGLENELIPFVSSSNSPKSASGYNYGESYAQIHMLNGDVMHQNGFRGQGIVIAQLDAGFYKFPVNPAFDSLRANNQVLGYKDFVKDGYGIYTDHTDQHGMWVLSIMAGIIPGHLIGSAPKASFWQLKTEELHLEYEIEEYNWVSGAEFADSVGADIITSSLGYTVFDSTYLDHTCSEMNGHTTVGSRGANYAFSKGIMVIVSAGNEGNSTNWHCVSSPADADYAVACAAVDENGVRGSFSSLGVDTAGRVKPNVAAMGVMTVHSDSSGLMSRGSGTSFSAPMIAGMTACLMQAKPGYPNTFYKTAIERSCSHFSSPDSLTGFGIPDFVKAMNIMGIIDFDKSNDLNIFPNPVADRFKLHFTSGQSLPAVLTLINSLGQVSLRREFMLRAGENELLINDISSLAAGVYLLVFDSGSVHSTSRMVKLPL